MFGWRDHKQDVSGSVAHKKIMMLSYEFVSSTEGVYLQIGTDEGLFNV